MRKRIIDYTIIVNFCSIPRTTKELSEEFNITCAQVNRVMRNLINEDTIFMEKISSDGVLKNIYVDVKYAKIKEVAVKIDICDSFPAHDPFGLAKGARNAR